MMGSHRRHELGRCFILLAALTPMVLPGETLPQPMPADSVPAATLSTADLASSQPVLAAGTEIRLRLLEPVGSHTHKRGDRFRLEVAEMVAVDGKVIVPAGSAAIGEVVHASKSGMSGKPGELILVARFLRAGDREVKLRSFVAGNGEDRYGLATGLGITVGIPALFVVGNNLVLPAGTDVYAKVTADTPLPSVMGLEDAEVPPPSLEESTMERNDNDNQD